MKINKNTKHWASITAGILSLAGYASAAKLGSEKYVYDASGNIIEKQIDNQVVRYGYQGNILNADTLGTTYFYDEAGRKTGETCCAGTVRKFTYQYSDKVTKVENGENTSELFYNAEGQLVGKNTNGQSEKFAWDGIGLAMRGGAHYTIENHCSGGVPTLIGNDVVVSDFIGSSLSVGDECFDSTAFGQGLQNGLFTGKPYISELNSFAFKHRNYGVEELKWLTPDPSGFPNGENTFLFSNGDPITYFDPNGLEAFVQDFAFITVSSPDDNGAPVLNLVRTVGTSVYSRYNESSDALGVCGYSIPPEGNAASFQYLSPSVIYKNIPVRHNQKFGGVDWSRFEAPLEASGTAYIADGNGVPVEGSSVKLKGANSEFYTRWIQEN